MAQVTLQIIADSAADLQFTLSALSSLKAIANATVIEGPAREVEDALTPAADPVPVANLGHAPKPLNKYAVANAEGKLIYDGNKAADAAAEFIALIENAESIEELNAVGDANEDLALSLPKTAGKKAHDAFAAKRKEFEAPSEAEQPQVSDTLHHGTATGAPEGDPDPFELGRFDVRNKATEPKAEVRPTEEVSTGGTSSDEAPPLEDVMAIGRSVVENVGAKALMEVLTKYIPDPDVKRQISNVPEAQRAAFVADCEKAIADRQKEVARGVKA